MKTTELATFAVRAWAKANAAHYHDQPGEFAAAVLAVHAGFAGAAAFTANASRDMFKQIKSVAEISKSRHHASQDQVDVSVELNPAVEQFIQQEVSCGQLVGLPASAVIGVQGNADGLPDVFK